MSIGFALNVRMGLFALDERSTSCHLNLWIGLSSLECVEGDRGQHPHQCVF